MVKGLRILVVLLMLVGALAIAPAASAAGTYTDDDGNFHEPAIEAITAAGIDFGCNPAGNLFCPSDLMTRSMMAIWLVRAMGQQGLMPTYRGYFSDVPPGAFYTPYVERLFELGVTQGVGNNMYNPSGTVTRAQMAVYLNRAFGNPAAVGPGTNLFGDVLTSDPNNWWFRGHVEAIYWLGITTGCSAVPLLYCPWVSVPRDQMASFVARAMGLPLGPPPPPPGATLDYTLPAAFLLNLAAGFTPDPDKSVATSGGPVDVSYITPAPGSPDATCRGFAAQAPDYQLTYAAAGNPRLRMYFIAGGDTTLIVNDPFGNWYCDDDSFGTNDPFIEFLNPASGTYDIWIGSWSQGTNHFGTFHVTEWSFCDTSSPC